MSKLSCSVLNYPVVIRKVGNEIFFSVPDLGFWKSVKFSKNLTEKNNTEISAKSSIFNSHDQIIQITPDFKNNIAECLIHIWSDIDEHLRTKKWIPDPSQIKQSLQTAEKDFTLPDFTKKLNQYLTISENTVRREIARGAIACYQTEGGHRRIPYSELQKYLSNQKNNLTGKQNQVNESIS